MHFLNVYISDLNGDLAFILIAEQDFLLNDFHEWLNDIEGMWTF